MNSQEINRTNDTDVLIIGSGPAGLHAACCAQDMGLTHRIIDRRGLAHSFVQYPQTLRFFSPPEEMEVGGVPFPMRGGEKPTREDILPYFRAVASYRQLTLSLWERITDIKRDNDTFYVTTEHEPGGGSAQVYTGRSLILASGIWDLPNRLPCAGADLPHVMGRFVEPTEYFGMDVLVVGGGNSALTAALSLAEAKARVHLAMRRPPQACQSRLRPWIVRDLGFAVEEHKMTLLAPVVVSRIEPERAWVQPCEYDPEHPMGSRPMGEAYPVEARFVFSLLGHRGDLSLFKRLGLCLNADGRPTSRPDTFETNVPNLFVAGSVAGENIDVIVTGRQQTEAVVRQIANSRSGH